MQPFLSHRNINRARGTEIVTSANVAALVTSHLGHAFLLFVEKVTKTKNVCDDYEILSLFTDV
jgi:hypothetical protein